MKTIYVLRRALEPLAQRLRRVQLWTGLAVGWFVFALLALTLAQPHSNLLLLGITVVALVSAAMWWLFTMRSSSNMTQLARRVEATHPELAAALLTAVEIDSSNSNGRLGFLETQVVTEALRHSQAHDWRLAVPTWRLRIVQLGHLLSLALFLFVLLSLAVGSNPASTIFGLTPQKNDVASGPTQIVVEPGDATIERGSTLLVVSRFSGTVPVEATLIADGDNGESVSRTMARSLDDPTFAAQIPAATSSYRYHVEFANQASPTYQVSVFEYPALLQADATLRFPDYTQLETKTIEDVRTITVVEGTAVTLACQLNKEVAEGRLVADETEPLPLVPHDSAKHIYMAQFTAQDSRRFRVQLQDQQGRANKLETEIVVNVVRNRPATVKMLRPGRDARVSPLEELTLKADVQDDFGVVRHGLSYGMAGQPIQEIVLGEAKPAAKQAKPEHRLAFESLNAKPDQLLTYHFWAEDIGPDGKPRRSSGDMFFAEVRHFEEIFRQGEASAQQQEERQQQQQQGGAAQRIDELAETQKQIINGTWKLIRREIAATPSEKFADDSTVLRDAQQKLIAQAEEMADEIEDEESRTSLKQAQSFMSEAVTQLNEGTNNADIGSLSPALTAEQAAYQALLKLRAREFEVQKQNQQQSQGQSARSNNSRSPSQAQLRQLDLSQEENRYETQREAREEQQALRNQQQQETQEVADRLKELAQRQTDLTDRLKELQSALEQANTETEKEEIERQLKRLREQQQQVLRDTDEVRDRMEQEQNRERMAQERRQLEQSRERVRQASEALDQGELSKAVTEGTRAGRELNELREEMRQKLGDRFNEEMREMREQARELDKGQQKLAEDLKELEKNPPQTLRSNDESERMQRELQQQNQQLTDLTKQMRETVREAEQSEPRLAQQLFDATRQADERKIETDLKNTQELLKAGILPQASESARQSAEGIGELRKNVEKAAESVMGGEADSLRQAERELEELSKQLNQEVTRNEASQEQSPGQGQGKQPGGNRPGNLDQLLERAGGGGAGAPAGPIAGAGYRDWYDRLRSTEELLEDPELRGEATRIRERVRQAREESQRHAKEPNWDQLKESVAVPLSELRERVAQELRKRESPDALVPIDRDPVPPEFSEGLRRYYERLGRKAP